MTLTARQLRQPLTIEAIERVPYFADVSRLSITAYIFKKPSFFVNIVLSITAYIFKKPSSFVNIVLRSIGPFLLPLA